MQRRDAATSILVLVRTTTIFTSCIYGQHVTFSNASGTWNSTLYFWYAGNPHLSTYLTYTCKHAKPEIFCQSAEGEHSHDTSLSTGSAKPFQ